MKQKLPEEASWPRAAWLGSVGIIRQRLWRASRLSLALPVLFEPLGDVDLLGASWMLKRPQFPL